MLVALAAVYGYAHRGMSGKKIEAVSAVWTLALYLLLGLVPLLLKHHS
jgi:hypothetical protein